MEKYDEFPYSVFAFVVLYCYFTWLNYFQARVALKFKMNALRQDGPLEAETNKCISVPLFNMESVTRNETGEGYGG